MKKQQMAGDNEIWVCAACGKTRKDRYAFSDSSCFLHAVLCKEDSIVRDEVTGFVTKADAVQEATN